GSFARNTHPPTRCRSSCGLLGGGRGLRDGGVGWARTPTLRARSITPHKGGVSSRRPGTSSVQKDPGRREYALPRREACPSVLFLALELVLSHFLVERGSLDVEFGGGGLAVPGVALEGLLDDPPLGAFEGALEGHGLGGE